MRDYKKLFLGTVSLLCAVLMVLCAVLAVGLVKRNTAKLPEVRNNGTAIQWKYSDDDQWHDLVTIAELTGTAGEKGTAGSDGKDGVNGKDGADGKDGTNGKDGVNGKDGADGKDGVDGKNIEVKRNGSFIQWRYEDGEWQNLVAISDITGPSGQNGENGKTAEFRVTEDIFQWRYTGEEVWFNLYDLTLLKGQNGKDGVNGIDGKNGQNGADGDTPFIGENGNWHIGDTDTGVKAAGENGKDGEKGESGKDGSCTGYCYMWGDVQKGVLYFNIGDSYSDLIYYNPSDRSIRLKKGHIYNLNFSGSLAIGAAEANKEFGAALKDNYDDDRCVKTTSVKIKTEQYYSKAQMPIAYNRFYNAQNEDIVLKLSLNDIGNNTYFYSFNYSITITALN